MKREFKEGQWVKYEIGTKCYRAIVLDSRHQTSIRIAYKNLDGIWLVYVSRSILTPEPPECDSWDWKSYGERQAEWVKQHGIKVGSRVKVTRAAESYEDGWDNVSPEIVNTCVGSVDKIMSISNRSLRLDSGFYFPYFVLEPVTEPEYRTPTDEDACRRIEVDVRDSETANWRKARLIGVLTGRHRSFFVESPDNDYSAWRHCRVKTQQ